MAGLWASRHIHHQTSESRIGEPLAMGQLSVYADRSPAQVDVERALVSMQSGREQRIRQLAYAIWEDEGRPHGKDVEHWLRAEVEIMSRNHRG
jgi:hypothetical protein